MIDFLRTISPYLYTFIPALIILVVAFYFSVKNANDKEKIQIKKFFKVIFYIIVLGFFLALIKVAMVNEVPRNDVDHSIKKERSNYAVEQAKQDTLTIN